jgi:hypothetical protein
MIALPFRPYLLKSPGVAMFIALQFDFQRDELHQVPQ